MLTGLLVLTHFFPAVPEAAATRAMTIEEMVALLGRLDERVMNSGDYYARVYLETTRGKNVTAQELSVYRRDVKNRLVLLFTKPKADAGKGYLRLDQNLWLYDPAVGKWERRTERLGIGGSDARRRDFDHSKFAVEFDPTFVGMEKHGKMETIHLRLRAKPGVDVAFPWLELWVEKGTENKVKLESRTEEGKLLLTHYFLKWKTVESASKHGLVHYPLEQRVFDEIDKNNKTALLIQEISLEPLQDIIFTKAWLESKSR